VAQVSEAPPRLVAPPLPRPSRLVAPVAIGAGALLLWLWIRVGFANNDTLFSLVWGQQLGRGETPQYDLAIAPTPHPLGTLAGLILSPLSPHTGEDVIVAIGYVALATVAFLVYRLGEAWFGRAAGIAAAALIITREPVLSNGIRAYVDIPYIALVLAALLVETRRRRAGEPVLALLAVAGLLRPEAWLFSCVYWLWIWRGGERERGRLIRLALLAAAGPLIWFAADAVVTGNPFWSLTQTRDTAATLRRVTGLHNVPYTGSRRLGEILRQPGLFAAFAGLLLTLAWLRDRARLGVAALIATLAAFTLLATAGLPIVTRYMLLPAALLSTFAGAAVFGWLELPAGAARRRAWIAVGAVAALALIAFVPSQAHRLDHTFDALARQQTDRDALLALVNRGTISMRCGPIGVPNHRPVPLLALYLHVRPGLVVDAQGRRRLTTGSYVDPANAGVRRDYTLDPHDPQLLTASVPAGFALAGGNAAWRVYERCG
jgi:hypothetical protein